MSDKITAAAESLASIHLLLPQKGPGSPKEDLIIIKEIVVDVPVLHTIGRQIIGCFGIGEFTADSIYHKISTSVLNVINEASAEELLELSRNARTAQAK